MPIATFSPPPRGTTSNVQEHGRILFIDAFDSFTNNIVGLLEKSLEAHVTVVRIDNADVSKNLQAVLKKFDAVVIGPGPGHPGNSKDVGLINQLWRLPAADVLPVFGVCLGFQSLCLNHGASVRRLRQARHGLVNQIHHNGSDIFEGIGNYHATQYHSLHIDLAIAMCSAHDPPSSSWIPTDSCPELMPLAWDISDETNGPVLMGVRHVEKPFWGVQFHPESICTSKESADMLRNWWRQASLWNALYRTHKRVSNDASDRVLSRISSTGSPWTSKVSEGDNIANSNGVDHSVLITQQIRSVLGATRPQLLWKKHNTGPVTQVALCETLGLGQDEIVMLDSQGHTSGRFSMIGIIEPNKTMKVTYNSWSRKLRYGLRSSSQNMVRLESIKQVWPILQGVLDVFNPRRNERSDSVRDGNPSLPEDCPFWGGFMGYISYEAGLESIEVDLHESCATEQVPDIIFAFVYRTIILDHIANEAYLQSLSPNDAPWMTKMGQTLKDLSERTRSKGPTAPTQEEARLDVALEQALIATPEEGVYRAKVLRCQESLAAGESYELCLTDETTIAVPNVNGKHLDAWSLYKRLRQRNPAPFGAFLRLSGATVVGSSPERFLRWDRKGLCQLRPIKGTVKKSPTMTRELAHSILNSSKERAENLMIVDLVRHDLSGVCGAENCRVPKLMVVEEYETVYQLVSVIEGQLPRTLEGDRPRGLDVLKASLPPGSMTGAPKKRSCEILRDIEQRPRGIYSGVLGYMDVGGGGDFSVVIRTAVRGVSTAGQDHIGSSSDDRAATSDVWRIGAGGAITIQSTDEGEFLEMETKVKSALQAFTSVAS